MVTMSMVWDRATQVMSGRLGMLATIAGLLGVLPTVIQASLIQSRVGTAGAMTPQGMATFGGSVMLVTLLLVVCALWSSLSLTAAASSPEVDSVGAALAAGGRRLPVMIGLSLLAGLVFALVVVPAFAILGVGALNFAALQSGNLARAVTPGAALGFLLYFLVLLVVGLWLSARLFLFTPVLVNERRGIGSFARSFQLTRGLTWRILGVLLLFGIVFLVVSLAVGAVAGILFGLLLGSSAPLLAAVLTQLVSGIVSAGFSIVVATFSAQLYRSVTGLEAAETFG